LARADGDPARVKGFHIGLRFSEDRVSQVLKQLLASGRLHVQPDEYDRRMRKVIPAEQLRLLFGEYRRLLLELLNPTEPPKY